MQKLGALLVFVSLTLGPLAAAVIAQQTSPSPGSEPTAPAQQTPSGVGSTPPAQPSPSESRPAPSAQQPPPAAVQPAPSAQQPSDTQPSASPATSTPAGQSTATPPSGSSPGQPGQQAQPSPAGFDSQQVSLDASAIIGSTVRGADGKDVGRVSRLMVEPRDGRVSTVVIGIGGMFGINEKLVSVPWRSVRVGQDDGKVVVTVDQGLLEQAPRAEKPKGDNSRAEKDRGDRDRPADRDRQGGAASPSTQR